ncbi:HlyD family secretion protein, partial [Paraburkholderia sp. SIMBA_050]
MSAPQSSAAAHPAAGLPASTGSSARKPRAASRRRTVLLALGALALLAAVAFGTRWWLVGRFIE